MGRFEPNHRKVYMGTVHQVLAEATWSNDLPELSSREAFGQTPCLPEGWAQGENLTMQELPLSTSQLPRLITVPGRDSSAW